jgi:hypothetical protein
MTLTSDQRELDFRSLCGLKGCDNRAITLIAWPRRYPVPMCQTCWDTVHYVVVTGKDGRTLTTQEWADWIKSHAKPHILPPERASV